MLKLSDDRTPLWRKGKDLFMKKKLGRHVSNFRKLFAPTTFESGIHDVFAEMSRISNSEDRSLCFEHLGQWLAKDAGQSGRYARFKFLFKQLGSHQERRQIFIRELIALLSASSMLRLFLQTGLSDQSGLLVETGRRIVSRIVPTVRENDFFEVSQEIIRTGQELEWLQHMNSEILEQFAPLFDPEDKALLRLALADAAAEAIVVFAAHLSNVSLTSDIRMRSEHERPSTSPFLKLQNILNLHMSERSRIQPVDSSVPKILNDCEAIVKKVYEDMEENGTSIGLVYRLEVMSAEIRRIRLLLNVITPLEESLPPKAVHTLLSESVEATLSGRSIIGHVHQQTHLLSRKIAERNGESGEHYIARGKTQRRKLFYSALKGGVIVVAMTIVKLTAHAWHLPPLMEANLIWVVYTAGFLAMQFTDSTLATKLPSFMASKLARLMTTVSTRDGVDQMVAEVKEVLVSQSIAFVGNILAVVPLALLLEFLANRFLGLHILDLHTSQSTLAGLHPLLSFAVPFGIITGILLWISSIAGGWFENWIVFRRIPMAIQHHKRVTRVLGRASAAKAAHWLEHNASGISANVTLGFLFGFVPFIGIVTGLPLDSRHVTISSASAALSALALERNEELLGIVLWACSGLLLIGVANLLVSFSLALIVAARASALNPKRFRFLLRLLGRRLIGRH